jgi:GR25 family glycosyltransferase involved in LPS biosynthesis
MGRKTICLNMIVKNEAHLIAETLAHLLTYMTFDYWVISDTGSTDATKEIIKDFFKSRNIPGELVEHAWQDFGYNRTKAFEAAYNKTDYAFVWDADDEIYGAFKMPENLVADSYLFTFGNHDGFRYSRHQLFNNRKRWCYKGVLHEYAACMEQTGPAGSVIGDYFFVSGRRGDRSKDPNKYFKDAQILEKASEKALAEKDPLYNRYIFYCAQSYASCNMHEKAIEFYKKALTIDMWVQEKYVSCLEIYEQYLRLGREIEGLPYLVQSHKYDRERIECIYRLIKYYTINEPIDVAYNYYGLIEDFYENRYDGAKLAEKLFAKKADYDFYLPYYMVITAEKSRHPETAAKMYEAILKHGYVADEWWLRNLVFNIQFCFSHLPKTTEFIYKFMNYIAAARKKGVTFEAVHLNVMQRLIDLYRPVLSLTDKKVSKPDRKIKVMMTFTTCKRLDLFEQTMNSILNSWTDLDKVDYFFCVDDNSSQRDRTKMQTMCPFMDFYMKRKGEKGHRASMNIIYDKLKEVQPTYWIHMEDDWVFFESNTYVQKSIDFLEKHKDKDIHQVLYNRNYAETYEGWDINGSEPIQGEPGFILHVKSDKIPGRNSAYWPHYSFRPSMIRVSTILELGNYDSPNTFFERDYADRYFAKGYKSAFFNTVSCLHIGKLTSDKTGPNAYSLNNMGQFNQLENKLPNAFVVNLVRRTDRKETTEKVFEDAGVKDSEYEFVEAVDGKSLTLTDEINTLFLGNDFGSRKGVIGCALSHYGLWKQLLSDSTNEYYTIFEDDIQLVDGFKTRWIAATAALATSDADIIFLGYHVRDIHNTEKTKVSDKPIVQLDSDKYIGGFFAYIITKKGCKKMLDYISTNGIKHGIDYLVKVVPGFKSYNCQPHIVLSDWVTSLKSTVDTDIQKDYSSLEIKVKVNSDEWTFYEGVDSGGDDIRRVNGPISEMMAAASADSRCVAFNTLGFLKSKATRPFKATPYISAPGTGIYVKKSYTSLECMNTRIPEKESYDVTDLVGVARRCDWFVYHNGCVNISKTSNPKTIYISASYVFLPYNGGHSLQYFMDNVLPLIKSKFNLVIAGNDFTFPKGTGDVRRNDYADKQELIQALLDNPLFNKGFVENLDTLHPKLVPIPLGILKNGQRGYHSNLELTNDVIDFSSRTIKCMCIHRNRGGPQWEQRARVTDLCNTTWSSFVTYYEGDTMNDDGISEKMKQAQFCICARGGGYDPSPKAWSALINGCIPIIQHSPLDEAYSRLPVILVDDFTPESLSEEKLDGWLNELREFYEDPVKRLEVLKMLSLDYWWSLINNIGPVMQSKWLTPFLCGGTGNRLFQIAAAMAEATKLGRELVFYKPMINNKTPHNISELYEMFPNIRIVDEAAQVYIVKELEMDNYTYKGFTGLDKVDKHIGLQGYWQNHQYLPSSGFNPVLKGQNLYSKYGLDTLDAKLNSWFIHVRLGDFKDNGCVNHITMESYYTKVLDKIPTGANVILFSDEPDLAHEQIRNHIPKSMQLRICSEKSISVCLGLMSQCWGGAVVPNSTFSWWGAYLARQASPKPELFRGYFPKRWGINMASNLNNDCNPPWAMSIDNTIEMTEKEEWLFYEGVDSGGADIRRMNGSDIDSMKAIAETEIGCVAFNTLGFLKSSVKFPLEKTPYIRAPGGIYVKKSYKPTIRVKMLCNWCSSEDLCKEWLKMSKGSYKWNDIEITWSDDNIDYYVIINKPPPGAKYVREKTIIFHMEPWCDSPHQNWGVKTWGEWAKPDPTKFLQVRTHDKFLNPGFWQMNLTYSQLKQMDMLKSADKSKIVSSICSSKYFDPGHKKRIDFLKFVEAKGSVKLHIYNEDNQHGFKSYQGTARPSVDKEKGLVPYKYYFMCENNVEANFITEKLWEPILCEALCFYWGCPNVAEHVDPMAYVQLNMDDFEASYNIMNAAIETNLWQERLPYIKKAKKRILDEQGFFPMLENALKPKAACFIHSCHLASAGTGTLDLVLSAAIGIKELNAIIVNNIGLPLDSKKYTALDSRIQIIQCSSDTQLFEIPTLRLMHEFSLNSPNTKILYLHTKGISYVGLLGYEVILDWINYMLHFLCTKSDDCLKLLDTHDAAGCNFSEAPTPHFSGNFWWANSSHLKMLDTALLTDKMSAEWWVLSKPVKKVSLWQSGKNHFKERYHLTEYSVKRSLVVYTYFASPSSDYNLEFYSKMAISYQANIDFIIVVNGHKCNVTLPQLPNLKVIYRDNVGFDFGGHKAALDSLNGKQYDYYFFMNSGVLGPFLDDTRPKGFHWTQIFIQKITDKVKLVSLSIFPSRDHVSCEGYFFMTDVIGLNLLLSKAPVFYDCPTKYDAIGSENTLSRCILNNGYTIDCMLNKFNGVNWQDKSNWTLNNCQPPSRKNKYFGESINPFETVFHKWFWDNPTDSMVSYDIVESYRKKMSIHVSIKLFVVFHNLIFDELYTEMSKIDKESVTLYGVKNRQDSEFKTVYEADLPIYNPKLQADVYNEGSAFYHIYKNNLYNDCDYIGFGQYDMKIHADTFSSIRSTINSSNSPCIFIMDYFPDIKISGFLGCHNLIKSDLNGLESGLKTYNRMFNKTYTAEDVIQNRLIMCNTFVIHRKTFEKLMSWLIQYYRDDINVNRHPLIGNAGQIPEALIGMFLSLEVLEGAKYHKFNVEHIWPLYKNMSNSAKPKKKGLMLLLGEAFRSGGGGNRTRGRVESYEAQIEASKTHLQFIKSIKEKNNIDMSILLTTYTTQYDSELINLYKPYMLGKQIYNSPIGLNALFHNSIKSVSNIQEYEFIIFIRVDLFLKAEFLNIFNPSWNTIIFPSITWLKCSKVKNDPRVNDMMIYIPRKYYNYINNIQFTPTGHELWHHLIKTTNLTYDDLDVMINTYHDSDSK